MKGLNDKQKWVLFQSLREQYNSGRPMTDSEQNNMWELRGYFWKKNGGKVTLGMKIGKRN